MSLSEFPAEVLDLCLEGIGTRDLFALRRTCRRLRDVVDWCGRVSLMIMRAADETLIRIGDVVRHVIEDDLIANHTERGLDFVLENVRELWLRVLPTGPFQYHYRDAHALLDSILQVFEVELNKSKLERVYIWPIVALDVDYSDKLMERVNSSSLDFVVPDVRFHKIYSAKNEHGVRLGGKFLKAELELANGKASIFPHLDLSLATRLTHLVIIGKPKERATWPLDGLQTLWTQCHVLKSVQFTGERNEDHFQIPYKYLTPQTLPPSLKKLVLSMCSITYDNEVRTRFENDISIVSIVCDSSMFLEPIVDSLNSLTLKTRKNDALDIMSTNAFAQSPLRRLSLHVNTLNNERLSQLSNLSHLEHLQINVSEKPTRNVRNSFRKFLAENPNLEVTFSIHKSRKITSWNMRSYLHI